MTSSALPIAVGPGEGATIQGPAGGPLTFKVRGQHTNGALTALENAIAPGDGPPLHTRTRTRLGMCSRASCASGLAPICAARRLALSFSCPLYAALLSEHWSGGGPGSRAVHTLWDGAFLRSVRIAAGRPQRVGGFQQHRSGGGHGGHRTAARRVRSPGGTRLISLLRAKTAARSDQPAGSTRCAS